MNEHTKNMLLQKLDIPEDKLYDKILDSKCQLPAPSGFAA